MAAWLCESLLVVLVAAILRFSAGQLVTGGPPVFSVWDHDAITIAEGGPLQLRCPLAAAADGSGGAAIGISWLRDGVRLSDKRARVLVFEQAFRDDQGAYRCAAANAIGTALSSTINVTVLYFDGFESTDPSHFVRSTAQNGQFVLSPPAIVASPSLALTWKWFFEDAEIYSNDTHFVSTNGDLVVLNARGRFGTYHVQVLSSQGQASAPPFTVTQSEITLIPSGLSIIYPPRDVSFIPDSVHPRPLILECVANDRGSLGLAQLRWLHNGSEVISRGLDVAIEERGRRLVIKNPVARRHSGIYQCHASSNGRSVTANAIVIILERPRILTRLPTELSIASGEELRFSCESAGLPLPTAKWYINAQDAGRRQDNGSLIIEKVVEGDSGVYQCDARNSVGTTTATIWVKVDDDSKHGPIIVEPPSNVTGLAGKDVVLLCKTQDVPPPTISWKFNGTEIPSRNEKYRIESGSLRIVAAGYADRGQYTCTARNALGATSASAFVQISGATLIDYGPSNQSVVIGSPIVLPCKIADSEASHGAKISWHWNDQLITTADTSRRFRLKPDGGLYIEQVGPDNIGRYTCTVDSPVGQESVEAWLRIIEKPSMPQQVVAHLENKTIPAKIRITWRQGFDGNSPIIKHMIEMRSMGPTGLWSDWESVADNVPSELCCSALIDNLKPSSTVEFRVLAVNRFGGGKPSLASNNITMPQQPPAAAPRNVAASARSSSSVMVQWQPPPSDQWNGDILGYVIRYRLADYAGLPWIERNVSNGHARNAALDHLITWREYEVQLAAYNHRGMGVFSKPLYVTTLEGVPTEAPRNVNVTVINSTAIVVEFIPPEQQMIPGVNQGYKIELWKGAPLSGVLYRQVRVLPDTVSIRETIDELEKYGHYNVTVLCFTSPGDGPRSRPIEVQTLQDLPGPVANVRFDQVLFSSVVVVWDPPNDRNGIITKYTVRLWPNEVPERQETVVVKPDHLNATIEGLTASTQYTIDVQAWTEIGSGPLVEAKFESGVPPELPGRVTSLTVSDIRARSATVQFIPGFDGHTIISKWIVEARVGQSTVFTTIFNISAPKARSFVVDRLRPFTRYQLRIVAENVRGRGAPSEPSRMFETRQSEPESAPENVWVEPTGPRSLSLVWTPLHSTNWNGDPKGYLIMLRRNESDGGGEQQWKEIRTSNVKAGDYVINELEPYASYELKMFAENTFGRSESSQLIGATTYESVPAGSPRNVQAMLIPPRGAKISWEEVPEELRNGRIVGYKVRVVPEEERLRAEYTRQQDVAGAETYRAHFASLRPFTSYRVFVAALTIVGAGPDNPAPPVVLTEEDIAGEPSNVAFSYVSETEVRIKWMPPIEPNGRISHYEISYWRQESSRDTAVRVQLPYNVFGFSATQLQPMTRYRFAVAAETSVGWGQAAIVPVLTTSSRVPPPIPPAPEQNLNRPQSSSQIWLKWTVPEAISEDQAPVRIVHIEYQKTNQDDWSMVSQSVAGTKNEALINFLSPNTPYRARIRYSSDFSQSVWSGESPWIKTLEAAPSSPPTSIVVSPFESSAMRLQWTPPPPGDWNSDSIGYRILYSIYPSNETFKSDEIPLNHEHLQKVEHLLRKLASFRHYLVQVQTFNQQGSSAPSAPVFVYVGYSIPKQNVSDFSANSMSSTSIALRWSSWKDPDDVISGFKIRYGPMDTVGAQPELEEIVSAEKTTFTLIELRKYTKYYISICAYNRAGEGVNSSLAVSTLEDRPSAPISLRFTDILLSSVNVSWTPPEEPNGVIVAYIVNYRTFKLKEEFKKEIQEKTSLTYLLADNLEENVTYFFSVRAETGAGYGPEISGNVTIGPSLGSPEPPARPTLTPGQTSVTLDWHDGAPGTSDIVGHIVQAKRVSKLEHKPTPGAEPVRRRRAHSSDGRLDHPLGQWVTITSVMGPQPRLEVGYRELQPASFYVFRLFARNSLGISYPSPESEQLLVPELLPDDPFYSKWWFLVIVALISVVVVVIVVCVLCLTGSDAKFQYEKRNSIDSLQLADGGIVSYELRASKRTNKQVRHPRHDHYRPDTNTSWISDNREPPAYGSIVGGGDNGSTLGMYGALATDVMPQQRGGGGSSNSSRAPSVGYAPSLPPAPARPNLGDHLQQHDQHQFSDFSEDDESLSARGDDDHESSIAQHYQSSDIGYRDTWRRVRQQEAISRDLLGAHAAHGTRPASRVSTNNNNPYAEHQAIVATGGSSRQPQMPGFSSFV